MLLLPYRLPHNCVKSPHPAAHPLKPLPSSHRIAWVGFGGGGFFGRVRPPPTSVGLGVCRGRGTVPGAFQFSRGRTEDSGAAPPEF
eukprot:671904-Hanusia_phi.AAC.1